MVEVHGLPSSHNCVHPALIQINVKGLFSGIVVCVSRKGTTTETLLMSKGTIVPHFTRRPLAEQRVAELRTRAGVYRQMAVTATTEPVRASLLRLAARFDALADQKERTAGH